MSGMEKCAEEEPSVGGGCRRSDPLFKLFGRSIPVLDPTENAPDARMWSDGKMATLDNLVNLIASPAEWSMLSHCHQDTTDEAPQFEDDCNGISAPEELGSCSGSSDGFDEDKSNQECGGDAENSGDASVVAVRAPEIVAEDSEIDEEKREEESNNEHESQDQPPKKPDPKKPEKLLPCPRCESLDTKFCYFNNYNINQPRHFCKNCQRYWTAGGTLRTVPVGAGRRKNKHSVSHPRLGLPEGIADGGDTSDSAQQLLSCSISHAEVLNRQLKVSLSAPGLQLLQLDACSLASLDSPSSSTILSFGKESPFRDSIASASLNLHHPVVRQGKARTNSGIPDAKVGSSWQTDSANKPMLKKCVELQNAGEMNSETDASESWQPGDDSTCGSSVTAQFPMQKAAVTMEQKVNTGNTCEPLLSAELVPGYTNGVSFPFLSGPWQYGYHVNWNNREAASTLYPSDIIGCNGNVTNSVSDATTSPVNHPAWNVAPQGIWTGVPWPLICSPLWNVGCWGGAWSVPWGPAAAAAVAATGNPGVCSLGKHPRERSQLEGRKEGSLWVPKTLRIDDPGEAAKSSIWRTLGLTNRPESMTSGGVFKAFDQERGGSCSTNLQQSPL